MALARVQGRGKPLSTENTQVLLHALVPDTVQVLRPPSPLTIQYLKSEDGASSFRSDFLTRCGTNFVSRGRLIRQNGSFRNKAASAWPP